MTDETDKQKPRPKRKGGSPKCPLCGLRRIKNCNACYWSQGCCREERKASR